MKNMINDASVNEWFAQQMASLTPTKMILALLMGFIVGMIIALVYRKAFRGVLFSPSFANTLIMLCMITTPVVMCIKSNIALSMGMVGALSIVRFRTAGSERKIVRFFIRNIRHQFFPRFFQFALKREALFIRSRGIKIFFV